MKRMIDYLDAAMRRMDLVSDSALARMMQVSPSTVSLWRYEKAVPSDMKIMFLAELAGWDKQEALFNAAYWRADEDTRVALLKAVKLAIVALCLVLMTASPALAGTERQLSTAHFTEIYIITQLRLRINRFKMRISTCFYRFLTYGPAY